MVSRTLAPYKKLLMLPPLLPLPNPSNRSSCSRSIGREENKQTLCSCLGIQGSCLYTAIEMFLIIIRSSNSRGRKHALLVKAAALTLVRRCCWCYCSRAAAAAAAANGVAAKAEVSNRCSCSTKTRPGDPVVHAPQHDDA